MRVLELIHEASYQKLIMVIAKEDERLKKRFPDEIASGAITMRAERIDDKKDRWIVTIKDQELIDSVLKDWNSIKSRITRRSLKTAGIDIQCVVTDQPEG